MKRILDPAVGRGSLLEPLISQLQLNRTRAVCVDVEAAALEHIAERLSTQCGIETETHAWDFLRWSDDCVDTVPFDCIVMNPPFGGRKRDEVLIRFKNNTGAEARLAPIEVAFVVRAAELLRKGGVLLAITPASLISGRNCAWARELLMQRGRVFFVHELPPHAFSGVEGRFYMMGFQAGAPRHPTLVCNHDLTDPEKLRITRLELQSADRWDFGFHSARLRIRAVSEATAHLRWRALGELVSFSRGRLSSPNGKKHGIHTIDCRDGVWSTARLSETGGNRAESPTDDKLLMRRVGRNCGGSVGLLPAGSVLETTDCVLNLSPQGGVSSRDLLLGIRTVLGSSLGPALVEHGTGAHYVTEDALRAVPIPVNIQTAYPKLASEYAEHINSGHWDRARCLEAELRSKLGL